MDSYVWPLTVKGGYVALGDLPKYKILAIDEI